MRRVAYKSVLDRVAGLLQGISSATANGIQGLDSTDGAVARNYIQIATQDFWTRYAWPELCVIERRLYRLAWDGVTTYPAGTELWYWPTRGYYQALQATNSAPAPLVSGRYTLDTEFWAEASENVAGGSGTVNAAADWDMARTYAVGELAVSPGDGEIYQAIVINSNSPPPSANWAHRTDFVRSIALAQAGQTVIQAARKVWVVDPRVIDARRRPSYERRFDVFDDEVVVRSGCGDSGIVWLEFWKETPTYAGEAWNAAAIYTAGQQIYFTDGDFWKCLATTTAGQSPLTTAVKWLRLDFPLVLAEMVAWRVFGEMDPLHGSGGNGSGFGMAEGIFEDEVVQLERRQGQAGQLNVLTR